MALADCQLFIKNRFCKAFAGCIEICFQKSAGAFEFRRVEFASDLNRGLARPLEIVTRA